MNHKDEYQQQTEATGWVSGQKLLNVSETLLRMPKFTWMTPQGGRRT